MSIISLKLSIGLSTGKQYYLYCLKVLMYYHGFNNLSKLLNIYLSVKIGLGILSCDLMYILFNFSNLSKFNTKCV